MAELVRRCTVVVHGSDGDGAASVRGSGFFVAPGLILTCAHVVAANADISITWCGGPAREPATVRQSVPALAQARLNVLAGLAVDFPDVALLEVPQLAGRHPCAPLVEGEPDFGGHNLFVYGVTLIRTGHPEADSSLLGYVGPVGDAGGQLLKLGGGFLASGQSGAAVLDLSRSGVCGIAKSELSSAGQDGGHAIPVTTALDAFPAIDLRALNAATHDGSLAALRAQQAELEPFVSKVQSRLKTSVPVLLDEIKRFSIAPPVTLAPAELTEWVTRQLFRLPLEQLVEVLVASYDQFSPTEFAFVRDATICCVAYAGDEAGKVWLPAGMVSMVRAEWQEAEPRLVHIAVEPETSRYLLLRALGGPIPLCGPLPASAEQHDPSGLPKDLVEDIDAALAKRMNVNRVVWSAVRPAQREAGRRICFVLDESHLTDEQLLGRLRSWYPGLRFIASGRSGGADEAPEQVLRLRPDLDVDVEYDALAIIGRSLDVA